VYSAIRDENSQCANAISLKAIAAAVRAPCFDTERMIKAIHVRSDLLKRYSNRESCLEMLEKIYNSGLMAKNQIPLKFEAEKATRERAAIGQKKGTI
jgi:hypothetical protein